MKVVFRCPRLSRIVRAVRAAMLVLDETCNVRGLVQDTFVGIHVDLHDTIGSRMNELMNELINQP